MAGKSPTVKELQEQVDILKEEVAELKGIIRVVKEQGRRLDSKMETRIKREKEVRKILEIESRNRKGAGTVVRELLDKTDTVEDYLLDNTKRIENVLSGLKTHREYLIKLNKKAFTVTPRELMTAELGVMNNTLGILSLNGLKVSQGLLHKIKKLDIDVRDEDSKMSDLKKRKIEIDERYDEEVSKFDIEKVFSNMKIIPGYR